MNEVSEESLVVHPTDNCSSAAAGSLRARRGPLRPFRFEEPVLVVSCR